MFGERNSNKTSNSNKTYLPNIFCGYLSTGSKILNLEGTHFLQMFLVIVKIILKSILVYLTSVGAVQPVA